MKSEPESGQVQRSQQEHDDRTLPRGPERVLIREGGFLAPGTSTAPTSYLTMVRAAASLLEEPEYPSMAT